MTLTQEEKRQRKLDLRAIKRTVGEQPPDTADEAVRRAWMTRYVNACQVAMKRQLNGNGTHDPLVNVLLRYPRLVAHLICESLGYFCPRSAACAIHRYRDAQPHWCEYYSHLAGFREGGDTEENVKAVGKERLQRAFEIRHTHRGYMAEYLQGRAVILAELQGHGPEFASWF